MRLKLASAVLFIVLMGACSVPKDITYFNDAKYVSGEELLDTKVNYEPKFKSGDKLVITVSALDIAAVTPFNLYAVSVTDMLQTQTNSVIDKKQLSTSQMYSPYTVDNEGFINFPVLGKIEVKGKTVKELTDILETRISESVENPIVNIRIENFKVTVIGEVLRPGTFNVYSDRISLLDALGLAGDLTIYGDRTNVKLVRDVNGEKKVVLLDLTKTDLLESSYFYLEQNDVVYVEPNDKKKKTSRYSQSEQYNLSIISTFASTLSVIVSVVMSIVAIKK
ncbi:polysaccharide biosynthesis/export family protein [Parabacteroides goldsteinii]|uniref:polysaccharide biosynthesis/export family protein n=1 Tax=Parabacteroides goldsteinii TaxID=328812 RepID=UPI00241F5DD8|nr:polysaccharide biosynthesis/export family protein [Parabacteroides goldsteinii]